MNSVEKRNKPCEDRINEQMQGRFEDLKNINNLTNMELAERDKFLSDMGYDPEDYETEDSLFELKQNLESEYPLAITKNINIRIELSTGGPGDYLDLLIDNESKELISGRYHFIGWFDGASRPLSESQLNLIESLWSCIWEY